MACLIRRIRVFYSVALITGAQTRLWFVAGERLLELLSNTTAREAALKGILATQPDEFEARVSGLVESNKKSAQQLKRVTAEVFRHG